MCSDRFIAVTGQKVARPPFCILQCSHGNKSKTIGVRGARSWKMKNESLLLAYVRIHFFRQNAHDIVRYFTGLE